MERKRMMMMARMKARMTEAGMRIIIPVPNCFIGFCFWGARCFFFPLQIVFCFELHLFLFNEIAMLKFPKQTPNKLTVKSRRHGIYHLNSQMHFEVKSKTL